LCLSAEHKCMQANLAACLIGSWDLARNLR
jgi:hypothetical protein